MDRHRWREFLPLVALPLTFLVVTILLHLEGRYLLPASPVWILFAAVPLSVWLGQLRRAPAARSDPGAVVL